MLVQLSCRSFRNLEELQWQPPAGCHLLIGPNGAGKTSLLEAIYLLATTRSFRSPRLAECGRQSFSKIELHYRPSIRCDPTGAAVLAQIEAVADRERQQRRPLLGPHRDEVELRWAGQPLRRTASAGERKAAGMILTAARGRVLEVSGKRPIYLLDDVDSELDEQRRAAASRLFSNARQVFLASSRPELWRQEKGVNRWLVERGALRPGQGRQ